jgi:hypothetical protein
MQLPVWVTVVISRFLGGFVVGFVAGVVYTGVVVTRQVGTPLSQTTTVSLGVVSAVVGSFVIGAVTAWLLPIVSGRHVAMAVAILATFIGEMIQLVGGALFVNAVVGTPQAALYLPVYSTAGPLVSLGLTVVAVSTTAWLIGVWTRIGLGRRRPGPA